MQLTPEGKRIFENALTDRNWTLEKLAEASHLSVSTVKRFSAQGSVQRDSGYRVCQTLGLNWRDIAVSNAGSTDPLTYPPNPFMQRGMLSNVDDVYGRDRELRQVFEFLKSGASVAFVGCAGLGTSSLLCAVEKMAPEQLPQRQPIYLNLHEILNLEDYYATLADAIKVQFENPLQVKRELRQRRILLFLDRVEQFQATWFTNEVRRQLRAWANMGDRSPIRLVIAAHRPLTELFEDSGFDSPFANICHEIELQPWNAETIQGFIETRLAETGIQFSRQEIDEIVSESGGIPSQVMQCCYRVYERYRDSLT